MKEETGYFSSFDGTKLFYRAWEKETANALIMVHGFGEHSGRYGELVEAFEPLPFSIFIHDLRGHGHSDGKRVYVDAFDHFVQDVYRFRALIEARKSAHYQNFVLLGQSLGALIAASAVLKNQAQWRALLMVAPFLGVPGIQNVLVWSSPFLNWIMPEKIWDNPVQPIFLTHDMAELERYQHDPLIQRRITTRLAREMFKGCASLLAQAKEISLPVLMLVAGDDRIVSVKKSKDFFSEISSHEKKMQIFDGFYHELLHEKDRQKSIAALKNYLARLDPY